MYVEFWKTAVLLVLAHLNLAIVLSIGLPFLLTYIVTSASSIFGFHGRNGLRKPPVIPYWIPVVGHALSFIISPKSLALSVRHQVQRTSLARLNFFGEEIHMISGPEAIKAVYKSKYLESKPGIGIAISRLFGGPEDCTGFYLADDSGIHDQPHPDSKVKPEHRIFYLTHKTIQDFFTGQGLPIFCKRFQNNLNQQISDSGVNQDWTDMSDLFAFLRDIMSKAAIEAMVGPQLLRINPNFIQDLWKFDNSLPYFFRGLPSWLIPQAWGVRQRCLDTIKAWRKFAEDNFNNSCIEHDGHDAYFGAPLMRWRNNYFSKIEPLSDDAAASEDFGLIWAENSTSVPAACWGVLELFQDPELLHQVREKAGTCLHSSGQEGFEVSKLCSQPLLQSIFAEILRVRTSQFIVRSDEHEDFHFKKWRVPKGTSVAIDTYAAHTDRNVWSTGSAENHHPVDQFWAQRFLTYPSDPNSGPLRQHSRPSNSIHKPAVHDGKPEEPKFLMSGLTGAWIPFAGGHNQCPGRTFAKQEVILGFSIVCSLFDIELRVKTKPEPNLRYYRLGGLPPKEKIPFRIRRRVNRVD